MSAVALPHDDRRLWSRAGGVALAAHLAFAAVVLAWSRPPMPRPDEPVVTVELPAVAAPATTPSAPPQPRPQPVAAQPVLPPIDLPAVRAPLPQNAVTLPPPAPQPASVAPAAAPAPAPAAPAPAVPVAASATPGDPRARKAELDYFSLISAHLNRRKSYPAEARKARQEGVVVIRFTVDRGGNVSGAAIKRTSGFGLLDAATLDLLRRVAPLPRMPASMQRDSVSIALPIEYSLKTS